MSYYTKAKPHKMLKHFGPILKVDSCGCANAHDFKWHRSILLLVANMGKFMFYVLFPSILSKICYYINQTKTFIYGRRLHCFLQWWGFMWMPSWPHCTISACSSISWALPCSTDSPSYSEPHNFNKERESKGEMNCLSNTDHVGKINSQGKTAARKRSVKESCWVM